MITEQRSQELAPLAFTAAQKIIGHAAFTTDSTSEEFHELVGKAAYEAIGDGMPHDDIIALQDHIIGYLAVGVATLAHGLRGEA